MSPTPHDNTVSGAEGLAIREGGEANAKTAGWTMRETAHINGGKEWFGYKHQCVQQPRLTRMDRYTRKDRSVASTWSVDGEAFPSFAEAVAALDFGPTMTLAELDAVAAFTAETMEKRDFADFQAAYPALRSLDSKGLVWWEDGKVSLRFDALASAIGATESNASGNPQWDATAPLVNAARAALASVQS